MALFDLHKQTPLPPADLREALIDAVAREDWQGLAALCEANEDRIRDAFLAWRKVPEEVRADPEAQGRYARGMIAVAQMFEKAGDRSLIAALTGQTADNPLSMWERALATAQSLLEQGQPAEAADLLQATLRRTEGLTGDGVTHYLPRTFGMLGVARFRAGDATAGIEATKRAMALCEQAGDEEGVAIYTGNLGRMMASAGIPSREGDDVKN